MGSRRLFSRRSFATGEGTTELSPAVLPLEGSSAPAQGGSRGLCWRARTAPGAGFVWFSEGCS